MSNEVKIDLKTTRIYDRNKNSTAKIIINRGGARASKGQPVEEPVLTPNGWKPIGLLQIGDEVFTQNGSITKVIDVLNKGIRDCYKFIFDDGSETRADDDHLWKVQTSKNRHHDKSSIKHYKYRYNKFKIQTSLELFDYFKKYTKTRGLYIDNVEPLQFPNKEILIDAYTLGVLLGNGYFGNKNNKSVIKLSCSDAEILERIKVQYNQYPAQKEKGDYNILGIKGILEKLGLLNKRSYEKFIPDCYLYNTIDIRKQILAGLLDTDGHCDSHKRTKKKTHNYSSVYFTTTSSLLKDNVKFLVNSLGGKVFVSERQGAYTKNGKKIIVRKYYSLCIRLNFNPFILERKASLYYIPYFTRAKILKKVEFIGQKDCVCISVGHDSGLYVTKDCIVTHNSFSIEQELLLNRFLTEENKQILVVRKTLPSLRQTGHKVWKDWMVSFGLSGIVREEKQTLNYYYNGNYLHFGGLDDPGKAQSTEFNYIWMQEAVDFTYEDYKVLKLRLSAPSKDGKRNQLFMCFNPIDEYHWIKTQVIDKGVDDFEEIHSTYKDNPFLSEDYIKSEILSLKEQDINYYNIFALGEWGRMSSLIFSNWCLTDEFPEDIDINNSSYGLDFGFNHPTALCENRIKDDKLFVREHIYEDGLTNSDLIKKLHQIIPIDKKSICIYADSAEPARIEEIAREGFRIEAAEKSVLNEIDFLKRRKIHIGKNSINIQKEIKGYSWRVDKNKRVLDEPVKYKDDLMAAMRYGVYGKFKNRYGSARIRWI